MYKPAGLSFHQENEQKSLVDLARERSGLPQLYPVHRLDRITSGLVLLARHENAARALGEMFAAGTMEKYYVALSNHRPNKKQGAIAGAMVKGRNGSWRLTRTGDLVALTQFFSYGLATEQPLRLFLLRPYTGRTHQLRVALKSLGSPILGDERYAGDQADRGYLHAYGLRFSWQDKEQTFLCPPTQGHHFCTPQLETKLAELGEPWLLPWPQRSLPQAGN